MRLLFEEPGAPAVLSEPVVALGFSKQELRKLKPVYHLTIAAAKDPVTGAPLDRTLTDAEWADIAEEYMDPIGLARRGEDSGVRWVAVRHAQDHVHVVATLARQDGRRPRLSNDRYRSMEASRLVERKYGRVGTAANGRTGAPATSRGEDRKHRATTARRAAEGRPGPAAPDREVLHARVRRRRPARATNASFFDRLTADGLLVRRRMSERNRVRSPGRPSPCLTSMPRGTDGLLRWRQLAGDLTLPRLQRL